MIVSMRVCFTSASPLISSHLTPDPHGTIHSSIAYVNASPLTIDFGSIGFEIDPVVLFGIDPISNQSGSSPSGLKSGAEEFHAEFVFLTIESATSSSWKSFYVSSRLYCSNY